MKFKRTLCVSTAIIGLVGAGHAFAATAQAAASAPSAAAPGSAGAVATDQTAAVPEVIVTAERHTSTVQKTAMNIAVVTPDTLAREQVHNVVDLETLVPTLNLVVATPNAALGLYGFGAGTQNPYQEPAMAFDYGGVYLERQTSATSSMYDLERVEVLKGPQGTLYGRNATVGVVNLVPAQPTDQYEGYVNVTGGNYDTIDTQGAVNLPLSDTLSARVAFQTTRHDGYLTSGYDDANNYGGRLSFLWKPNDNVSLLVWGDAYVDRSKGPTSILTYYIGNQRFINPSNPWQDLGPAGSCSNQIYCPSLAETGAGGINIQPNSAGGAKANGFLDTSPTGLAHLSVEGDDGYDHSAQYIYAAELNVHTGIGLVTVIGSGVKTNINYFAYSDGLVNGQTTDANQLSLEARLSSEGDKRLKWVVGTFLYGENDFTWQENLTISGSNLQYIPHLDDRNYAFFGDTTYSVTHRIRLLAGIRYTNELKTQDGYSIASGLAATGSGPTVATLEGYGLTCYLGSNTPSNYADIANAINRSMYPVLGDFHYPSNICFIPNAAHLQNSNVSWKAGIEGDITSNSMLYFTAKTGFRSGGFAQGENNTYKPEELTSYEVGSRNRFFDGKLQVNATGFYWDYKDQQIVELQQYYYNALPVGQAGYPSNISGNLYGAELNVQAAVTPWDTVTLDGAWTKGKLDKTPPLVASNGTLQPLYNVDRPGLPEDVLTAIYNHTFVLPNDAKLDASVQTHYESRTILALAAPGDLVPGDIRDPFWDTDISLTYHSPDHKWELEGWVKNVTNVPIVGINAAAPSFYRPNTTLFTVVNGAPTPDVRGVTIAPPRTFGFTLTDHF